MAAVACPNTQLQRMLELDQRLRPCLPNISPVAAADPHWSNVSGSGKAAKINPGAKAASAEVMGPSASDV